MSNPQFSVSYNGHPTAVTVLGDGTYIVQVSYKPLHIQSKKNNDGTESWIEVESRQETFVTREVGRLISQHYAVEHI